MCSLTKDFYLWQDATILCENDYYRRMKLICNKCNQPLKGPHVQAVGKKFHLEHFTCYLCATTFGPEDVYYEHQKNVYCHYHFSVEFAHKCVGCNMQILEKFVESEDTKNRGCWHPECFLLFKACHPSHGNFDL